MDRGAWWATVQGRRVGVPTEVTAPAAACQSMWILKRPNVNVFNSLLQEKRDDF